MKTILAVATVFVLILGAVIYTIMSQESKLYDECLKDGHKSYECFSYIHGGRR